MYLRYEVEGNAPQPKLVDDHDVEILEKLKELETPYFPNIPLCITKKNFEVPKYVSKKSRRQ
jgi:hypothetical protein